MTKFKVGDEVLIASGEDYYHSHKKGAIGVVVSDDTGGGWVGVEAEHDSFGDVIYQEHPEDALELANPPLIDDEVAKFKVGDKVRVLTDTYESATSHYVEKGRVLEVVDMSRYSVYVVDDVAGAQYIPFDEVELVNPPLIDDEGEPARDDLDTYMVRIGNGYLTESYEFILPGRAAVFEGGMNYGEAESMANITGGEVVALTTVPVVEE